MKLYDLLDAIISRVNSVTAGLNNCQPKGDYAKTSEIPKKVSQLANDVGYLTEVPDTDGNFVMYVEQDLTEEQKTQARENIDAEAVNKLPDYWDDHLTEKIATIKELQRAGGKDCYSFVVLTDYHRYGNIGKCSPSLIKRIIDECGIKFCLCLGDMQNQGAWKTKELELAEWEEIEKEFTPVRDRTLMIPGNHDGAYGSEDINGDGEIAGTTDYYIYNLTPAEMYDLIYRKVGLINGVTFDESHNGYYVDDPASKVRYILVNTHYSDGTVNEDGTAVNNYMRKTCIGQAQVDMVIDSLMNIPANDWHVVVGMHIPLVELSSTDPSDDMVLLRNVLEAYQNKTTFSGTFGGNDAFSNLADPTSEEWIANYRLNSSGGLTEAADCYTTNFIPCESGDLIQIKGLNIGYVNTANTRAQAYFYGEDKTTVIARCNPIDGVTGGAIDGFTKDDVNALWTHSVGASAYTILSGSISDIRYARFSGLLYDGYTAEDVVISVNQEINASDSDSGTDGDYDDITVNADFTSSKGEVVGVFCGHVHCDKVNANYAFPVISSLSDDTSTAKIDGVVVPGKKGTVTEQSFDVFTVNKQSGVIHATKIGYGSSRLFVDLMKKIDIAIGSVGGLTNGMNYYYESGFTKAITNPLLFYIEEGSTLSVSLSDNSIYQIGVQTYLCPDVSENADFTFTEGTSKNFGVAATADYWSGWQDHAFTLEVETSGWHNIHFRRTDGAALTGDDVASLKRLLSVMVTR